MPAASVIAPRPRAVARDGAGVRWRVDTAARVAAGRVLAVHADLAHWRSWRETATAMLDDAERARVARLHRAADRDDRAIAYALHRLVVAGATGIPASALHLARDARGCPRLALPAMAQGGTVAATTAGDASRPRDIRPLHASPLYTSLSHGDGVLAIAIGTCRVGIDVEASARAAGMAGIAPLLCHDDEGDGASDDDALLALWVRKEALLKATGQGLGIAMTAFRAPAARPLPWPDGAPGRAVVRMLDAGVGWRLALATAEGVAVDHLWLHPVAGAVQTSCPATGRSRVR